MSWYSHIVDQHDKYTSNVSLPANSNRIQTLAITLAAAYQLVDNTHTHPFNGPFLGLPRWAGTRKVLKVKPIWILLKQETVSGSGMSWAICKSAPRSRQINTPAPHHSVFLQARCPSCCPTNSVKALKAVNWKLLVDKQTPNCTFRVWHHHCRLAGFSCLVQCRVWKWRGSILATRAQKTIMKQHNAHKY